MRPKLHNILASEGLITKRASGTFNANGPFGKRLASILEPLMGPDSRVYVRVGRGEFSGEFGLQVGVTSPKEDIFPSTELLGGPSEEDFFHLLDGVGAALFSFFGSSSVEQENTEDQAIEFTVVFPKS